MKQDQRGFSSILLLILIGIAVGAGMLFYFSKYQQEQSLQNIHTSSGVYTFADVFKTDIPSLNRVEEILKNRYQLQRTYTTNIRTQDYYPFENLESSSVRNSIIVQAEEEKSEIVRYCVVHADRPDDKDDAVCIDTQDPDTANLEEYYTATFYTKIRPYRF